MGLEKISKTFVYAVAIYLIVLLYSLSFIFSNLSFGGLTLDFWILTLIILMPAILSAIYYTREHLEFLYGKEKWLKRLIIAFIVLSAVLVILLIVPLSY